MSNDQGVMKLGKSAALATNGDGHDAANRHAGTGAEVHQNAEVYRVFKRPGDNDYVVCPNGDVPHHAWDIKDENSSVWTAGVINPLCIIIRSITAPPVTQPASVMEMPATKPATMYLGKSAAHRTFDGLLALRRCLEDLEWTENRPRWIVRVADDKWLAIEHT